MIQTVLNNAFILRSSADLHFSESNSVNYRGSSWKPIDGVKAISLKIWTTVQKILEWVRDFFLKIKTKFFPNKIPSTQPIISPSPRPLPLSITPNPESKKEEEQKKPIPPASLEVPPPSPKPIQLVSANDAAADLLEKNRMKLQELIAIPTNFKLNTEKLCLHYMWMRDFLRKSKPKDVFLWTFVKRLKEIHNPVHTFTAKVNSAINIKDPHFKGVESLYQSKEFKNYVKALKKMAILYPEFSKHASDYLKKFESQEFLFFAKSLNDFNQNDFKDFISQLDSVYHPIIFLQTLIHHKLIIEALKKNNPKESSLQSACDNLAAAIKKINESLPK